MRALRLGRPMRRDAVAGFITGLFSIPEGMAHASIGGFNPALGLYSGMVAGRSARGRQEGAVKAATVPYMIVRATQFFEFIGRIADSSADGETVRLPPLLFQPEAADDVAAALADVGVSAPVNGTVEPAGLERFRLDELARRVLRANNDPRRVTADVHARYVGAELDDHSLTPGDNPRIAPTRIADWLSQSTARQANPWMSDSQLWLGRRGGLISRGRKASTIVCDNGPGYPPDRTVRADRRSRHCTCAAPAGAAQEADRRRVGVPGGAQVLLGARSEHHWLRLCCARLGHLFPLSVIACDQ